MSHTDIFRKRCAKNVTYGQNQGTSNINPITNINPFN